MYNLFSAEFFRLRRMFSYKIILLVIVVFSLFVGFISLSAETPVKGLTSWYGAINDSITTLIFGAIFSGLFIGAEFSERNIGERVAVGHSRHKILVAKSIVYLLAISVFFIAYPLASSIVPGLANGFGGNFLDFMLMLRTTLLSLLLVLADLSVCILLSFWLKKTGPAVSGCLVTMVLLRALFSILYSVFPGFSKIAIYTSMGCQQLAINPQISLAEMVHVLVVAFAQMAIFISISYLVFRRDEIK